jgi:2,5-diketo-D-gluconate reductase A
MDQRLWVRRGAHSAGRGRMGGMTQTVTIADGVELPLVGFGTWQVTGRRGYEAIRYALTTGYRHIDTATMYGNEREVGQAVRDSGIPRDQVFITTKLLPRQVGRERETLDASLRALGTDYIDLWLIHWAPSGRARPDVWERLLDAQREGRARAVGVSNYSVRQIDELIEGTGQAPAVNQIPWSPSLYDERVLADSRERGVVIEGYSPFKRSDLRHPVLIEIAARHQVTPAQVVVRWHVEHRIVVIPKSVTPDRIRTNLDVFGFTLTAEEVARIDALGD